MGLRSFGYDSPYAIEPFEPLQEKVGYKAVPLLVQLSSKPKSLRLLVRALRLSIPSHPIPYPGFFSFYDYGSLIHYGYLSLSYVQGFR
jgi:hypothetical protein